MKIKNTQTKNLQKLNFGRFLRFCYVFKLKETKINLKKCALHIMKNHWNEIFFFPCLYIWDKQNKKRIYKLKKTKTRKTGATKMPPSQNVDIVPLATTDAPLQRSVSQVWSPIALPSKEPSKCNTLFEAGMHP